MQNFIHLRLACAQIVVLLRIQDNGVKGLTVGLPTVCEVWELAKTKQFCVHAYAQQCDTNTK